MMAATFLPLDLVAGIYGMKFDYIPELHYRWGNFIVIDFLATIVGAMSWFVWDRHWFGWGGRRLPRLRCFAVDPETVICHLRGNGCRKRTTRR